MSGNAIEPGYVEGRLPFYEACGLNAPPFKELTDEEWLIVEGGYGHPLPEEVQFSINTHLRFCAWFRHAAENGVRKRELKAQVRAFLKGLCAALKALAYPAFEEADRAKRIAPPPSGTWSERDAGFQAWSTLIEAGKQELWTRKLFRQAEDFDLWLRQLHALAYLAQLALEDWPSDKGGARASYDQTFVTQLRRALCKARLPAGYAKDEGDSSFGGLSGPLPQIVRELLAIRPAVFTSGEQSQFAKLIRQSRAPNPRP